MELEMNVTVDEDGNVRIIVNDTEVCDDTDSSTSWLRSVSFKLKFPEPEISYLGELEVPDEASPTIEKK